MKRNIAFVSNLINFLLAFSFSMSSAIADGAQTVLNFDDVPAPADYIVVPMPAGYGGVIWPNNMGIYGNPQPPYNPQSPPNRVAFKDDDGRSVSEFIVTFINGPKIFDGAYFSGYNQVHFNLYTGTSLVGVSGTLDLGSAASGGSGPAFLASGYTGPVDKVGIVGRLGFLTMDDFTFEQVPEPSSAVLFAFMATVFGIRTRR